MDDSLVFTLINSRCFILLLPFLYLALLLLYRLSPFHPLTNIPGPIHLRLTSLWLYCHAWVGDEATWTRHMHRKYGSVICTGPNTVDISDGAALEGIYGVRSGMKKPDFYGNFDVDGHASLFSERNENKRSSRAKAIAPVFGTAAIRAGKRVLHQVADSLVTALLDEKSRKASHEETVGLLTLCRAWALDSTTAIVFSREFGALKEVQGSSYLERLTRARLEGRKPLARNRMSASGMVDFFIDVGRYWYLPPGLFGWIMWLDLKFGAGSEPSVSESFKKVDEYVSAVVTESLRQLEAGREVVVSNSFNFATRLLATGVNTDEAKVQCTDLMFAGTHSTAVSLLTILFYIAKDGGVYEKLRSELAQTKTSTPPFSDDPIELQSLPYLRAVIREGLRMAMPNPTRLPRIVAELGWNFAGFDFPAGTEVSCTPLELHFNDQVFGRPREFRPDRWLEGNVTSKMQRDYIPFSLGPRQCIARNLASAELCIALKAVIDSDCLRGVDMEGDSLVMIEWFNSKLLSETNLNWTTEV